MMITLLVIFLMLIFLCNLSIYNINTSCTNSNINIKYVRASKLQNIQENKLGINVINVKLDRNVPCGIYKLKTVYGNGFMYVDNSDPKSGYLNVQDMSNIINVGLFDLWDLNKITSDDDQIIKMYNTGCCNKSS